MKKKDENNIFLESLTGVTPIKKKNNVKRSIPKQKLIIEKKINIKKIETNKSSTKKATSILPKKFKIEKSSINRKLKKGKIPISQKTDFHGCSFEEAKQLFINTINNCFINNKRCILFITGKGVNKKQSDNLGTSRLYYGKIRNSFLSWTAINEVRAKILNVEQANIENGGDGAFFVYLRKNRN